MRLAVLAVALALPHATATIEARDNQFVPATVTVAAGEIVTWRNTGSNAHEVTSSAFKSGNLAPGATFSWTAKSGTYSYVCRYHESLGMRGTVVVAGSASHPKTGGGWTVPLGLLVLGAAGMAGVSLRYGWRVR